MEWFQLIGLIADLSMAALVAALFVFATRSRDSADARGDDLAKSLIGIVAELSGNIRASTEAITALKTCEDETQNIVSGFRREVMVTHGSQLESLKAIQEALAPLPSMAAAVGRIEPSLAEVRALVEGARDSAADYAITLSSILLKLDGIQARPVTPGRAVATSAERVRIEQQAREQIAAVDAQHGGERTIDGETAGG